MLSKGAAPVSGRGRGGGGGPFLVFPLPLSGDQETHTRASTLSRRGLSGPTPDAETHTREQSPGGLKSFFITIIWPGT